MPILQVVQMNVKDRTMAADKAVFKTRQTDEPRALRCSIHLPMLSTWKPPA